MTKFWLACATVVTMLTSGALAQTPPFDATNSTQPTASTNGPAGTYDTTKTTRTKDATGVETNTIETFNKNQTYTSGNGELSAGTSIKSGTTTTVTAPPPLTTTTSSSTTTTREMRP